MTQGAICGKSPVHGTCQTKFGMQDLSQGHDRKPFTVEMFVTILSTVVLQFFAVHAEKCARYIPFKINNARLPISRNHKSCHEALDIDCEC